MELQSLGKTDRGMIIRAVVCCNN